MNTLLLSTAFRVWLMETLVSGFNFFVLMGLVYEPAWGTLIAHQVGMTTRIVYIFVFAYLLLRYVKNTKQKTSSMWDFCGWSWNFCSSGEEVS